jgi:hypothetical protein
MNEGYDDCYDIGLEEILEEGPEITDFENPDAWQEEIDMAIREFEGDLYFLHSDEYLEEIEKGMDEFRNKFDADDHSDWQEEVDQAIDEVRQNEG